MVNASSIGHALPKTISRDSSHLVAGCQTFSISFTVLTSLGLMDLTCAALIPQGEKRKKGKRSKTKLRNCKYSSAQIDRLSEALAPHRSVSNCQKILPSLFFFFFKINRKTLAVVEVREPGVPVMAEEDDGRCYEKQGAAGAIAVNKIHPGYFLDPCSIPRCNKLSVDCLNTCTASTHL